MKNLPPITCSSKSEMEKETAELEFSLEFPLQPIEVQTESKEAENKPKD